MENIESNDTDLFSSSLTANFPGLGKHTTILDQEESQRKVRTVNC